MPIDKEKLLAFEIPQARQLLTPKDVALYALSVGVGREGADEAQLRFVDPLRGPVVMPAMALVMANPGFWLGHPNSGVDPKAVLHLTQNMELTAPLPNEGEVRSSTRIVRLVDKGSGKAALIDTLTELEAADGTLLARLARTTYIRGGGGFGGEDAPMLKPSVAPTGTPDFVIDLPTGREQALLYRLNGDLNPLHSDPAVAAGAGFEVPILHGLCTAGVAAHAILRALARYQADRFQGLSLRFTSPVFPGETVRTEIWRDGAFRVRALERDVVVVDDGRASIR